MAEKRKLTKAEIEKIREGQREIALKNLGSKKLVDRAIAYHAQGDKSGFGENDNAAVYDFLYLPSMSSGAKAYDFETGKEYDVLMQSLDASRKDGRRYSGRVDDFDIIQTSADIITKSLERLKVDDFYTLMGSDIKIDPKYQGKYLAELAESGDEETKKFVQTLIAGYIGYKTLRGVSDSLSQRAKQQKSGLENLVRLKED